MNGSASNLFVWVGTDSACVRVTGRANFTTSVDFKRLMQHLQETGRQKVVLDLSECLLMDSTFLGVLASEGQRRFVPDSEKGRPGMELVNANQRIRDLIENLGVAHLFCLVQSDPSKETFEPVQVNEGVSREEITRTCLQAHEALMAINPSNIPKFKDVTQFFAETLKKAQAQKDTGTAQP
jgi:anti-sigma B factor antagonist